MFSRGSAVFKQFYFWLPSNLRDQRNTLYPSVHFFACPNKGLPVSCPAVGGIPGVYAPCGYSSMLPGACKLGFASNNANSFFSSLSGARLRANGIFTAMRAKDLADIAWQSEIKMPGWPILRYDKHPEIRPCDTRFPCCEAFRLPSTDTRK